MYNWWCFLPKMQTTKIISRQQNNKNKLNQNATAHETHAINSCCVAGAPPKLAGMHFLPRVWSGGTYILRSMYITYVTT